jgi:mono/diheme cytochrome c family protein
MRSVHTVMVGMALGLVVLSTLSCGDSAPAAPRTAAKLWSDEGCALCHGKQAEGTKLAPTLQGKATHWSRESLLQYLRDPVGYAAQDPRLKEQMKSYSQAMPTYKMLSATELETLADYVLGL